MSLSSLNSIGQTVFELESGNGNFDGQKMDKRTHGIRKFNSKLNFYKLIPYLVDRCICLALFRSRQTLEKNVLSWALAGTGSVLFTRQVAVQPTCRYTAQVYIPPFEGSKGNKVCAQIRPECAGRLRRA